MLKKVILALALLGLFGATTATASAQGWGCAYCGGHHGHYHGGYAGPYRGFHRSPASYFMPYPGYGYYYPAVPAWGGYGYGWGVQTGFGL